MRFFVVIFLILIYKHDLVKHLNKEISYKKLLKMSDSSEDEDLSRFRDAVDTTFTKLIDESRGKISTVQKRGVLFLFFLHKYA